MRAELALAVRLAWRDGRGGLRGVRVVLACLALGVGAIATVGSLRAAIDRGMAVDGRRLLGGDVAIASGSEPLPAALRAWLLARGGRVSEIAVLRSLLVAPSGRRMLVEVKAVDAAYPLVGAAAVTPAASLQEDLASGGLVADPLVLERLGTRVGDAVRLGSARLRLSGVLEHEPDGAAGARLFGPRVMIGAASLPPTGLIEPGSLVDYEWRVRLAPGDRPARFVRDLRRRFPATGWRVRLSTEADPSVATAVDQTATFLVLVGLAALLVGGIGVATGIRAWLEGRAPTIATLRCLGAGSRLVFLLFLVQVLGLCAAGVAIGVAAGAALPVALLSTFGAALPVPAANGVYPGPLALAAAYGLLTAATFALWPLGRAVRIPGAALFRNAFAPDGGAGAVAPDGRAGAVATAANGAAAALLVLVVVLSARDRMLALGFCAAAAATLLVFRAGAWGLMAAARRSPATRPVWLRLGVANLHRPANATTLLVLSLGLGLATVAAVALVEGNIRAGLSAALPKRAPSFFFIDIQNDELDRFDRIVAAQPGTSDVRQAPSLRARIVSLKGVPVDRAVVSPGSRWALRGDRGLTWDATVPEGSRVVAGRWWARDYQGPPLLSLDRGLARGWGLAPGDALTANVLGRDIAFRVANLRAIDWRALTVNFTLVASPGLLEHAPQMHVATVRTASPRNDAGLLRAVSDALPNVTGIRVADVIASIELIVGKLATALLAAGSLTVASGALVLAGALAAGQRRRTAEAVICKTLGGTRGQIRAAWLVEFGLIGLTAGALAAALGTVASWAVMRFALRAAWAFLPGTLALVVGGCVAVTLLCGWLGTGAALRARAAPQLRN